MNIPEWCERCQDEPALVGWADPPQWIGKACYDAALRQVGLLAKDLQNAITYGTCEVCGTPRTVVTVLVGAVQHRALWCTGCDQEAN